MIAPRPPLRVTASPGTSRSASATVSTCRAARSADVMTVTRVGRARQRRVHLRGRDDDRLGERADAQMDLDVAAVAGAERQRQRIGLEAVGDDADVDASGRQGVEGERAARVGRRLGRGAERGRGDDAGVRDGAAVGIDDAAGERRGVGRARGRRASRR